MNREPTGAQLMESMVAELMKAGLTCRQIAKESGLSLNTIWRLANRQAPEPMWSTFCRLRDFHKKVMPDVL
ncbi:hypothetical protein B9J07_13565 [Sinorhizobium sp. LM21]|nr:hypothetical protein B9J07_13565 [Sinorhizobium sp. LM21]